MLKKVQAALEDDIQFQIDAFAEGHRTQSFEARTHGRENAIRAVCVNNPEATASQVRKHFDRLLAATIEDPLTEAAEREWLKFLRLRPHAGTLPVRTR